MAIYYLSFHKAPPSCLTHGQSFSFAPTIHNDLREDVFACIDVVPQRIVAAWLSDDGEGGYSLLAKAAQIDWIDGRQAYRNVTLNAPRRDVVGRCRHVRLALFIDQQQACGPADWQYDLDRDTGSSDDGLVFVPGISSRIQLVTNAGLAADNRSTALLRTFSVGAVQRIEMEELPGYHLEGHLWDAALHLTSWLGQRLQDETDPISRLLSSLGHVRVLELGAGTGMVSIALAVLLSRARAGQKHRTQVSVTATDLPPAMELLQRNIAANACNFAPNVTLNAKVIDWDKADDEDGMYDLILVADCTYNPSYFSALSRAIKSLLAQPDGRCYLAKKHRHIDEDALWPELERNSLAVQRIRGQEARLAAESDHAYTGWCIYMMTARDK